HDERHADRGRLQEADLQLAGDAEALLHDTGRPAHRLVKEGGEDAAVDAAVIAHVLRLRHEARPDDAGLDLEADVQPARVLVAADETAAVVRQLPHRAIPASAPDRTADRPTARSRPIGRRLR